MFVPHVLGFLPPPVVESVVSCGCSRLEESGSLYLVDPIAIIEVRGEEVLASTLDGDRLWRRGPGVPGGSELCLRDWFGTYMEIISIYACCCCTGNLSFYLTSFLTLLKIGHLKLHTVGDVNLSHSLGIDFECAGCEFDFDNNIDGWYDRGMRRFAQGCLWA
jgi:hypothetical protein